MGVAPSPAAATPGLIRSDPHGPGISRVPGIGRVPGVSRMPGQAGFGYLDPSGAAITDGRTLDRIRALRIPPAWTGVWISADPLGHIQATGVDGKGRTQYLYHQLWRDQRDAQKFAHMLRFAAALPGLRDATLHDLTRRGLRRDRVAAGAVRLIDLGLFRVGGEKYAELDHHYGATTLKKTHVRLMRDGIMFDYVAKAGKERTIVVQDRRVLPIVRSLARQDTGLDALFVYQQGDGFHLLHSQQVNEYIAGRSGGHFTAKEFRTWNATLLMALTLASAGQAVDPDQRKRVVTASVREVARWLGDTPAVARGSYIDPRLIARYEATGGLPAIPAVPPALPAPAEAEQAVAGLLRDLPDAQAG